MKSKNDFEKLDVGFYFPFSNSKFKLQVNSSCIN
jgi:hypothetical protein